MKDFWDSLARIFGYEHWEWGSAADWVGAIGTAGAFLFGFLIFWRDKQRQRRELADRFATWLEAGASPQPDKLFAHNGAELPVVDARAFFEVETGFLSLNFDYATSSGRAVKAATSTSIPLRDNEASASEIYVQFTDGTSQQWIRNLRTGRYLNRWQRYRLKSRLGSISR